MLIFCYGTLMSGFSNNSVLGNSKFIGRATTKEKYSMYARGIPFVTSKEKTNEIIGEVYEVTDALKRVDMLEGHPSFYIRVPIPVILENGEEVIAELYFNNKIPATATAVANGDFRTYADAVFKGLI